MAYEEDSETYDEVGTYDDSNSVGGIETDVMDPGSRLAFEEPDISDLLGEQ